jgi:hypothetical protein
MLVHEVVLPLIRGIDKGDYLHVAFERGSHSAQTKEVMVAEVSSIGDTTIEFHETLNLDVTLYQQSSNGKYQVEKYSNISNLLLFFTTCNEYVFSNRKKLEH